MDEKSVLDNRIIFDDSKQSFKTDEVKEGEQEEKKIRKREKFNDFFFI